jgi:glutathione S-transferase
MSLQLVVGSKNYSSWSMRAGVALLHTGLAHEEIVIPLGQPDTRENIARYSAAGLVPILINDAHTIWDSLAIIEYLAEIGPANRMWPSDPAARATARSMSAEMHAGFGALRRDLPMNCRRRYDNFTLGEDAARDVARICDLWRDARNGYGRPAGGDFLFGDFSGADAMFAPVVSRFVTYGVSTDATVSDYVAAVMGHPTVRSWIVSAKQEPVIARYEFD